MDNILIKIDKILEKGFVKMDTVVSKTFVTMLKNTTKGGSLNDILKATPSSPLYNSKFTPLYTATTSVTKQIVKDVVNALDAELDVIAKTLGIEVERVRFLQSVKKDMFNFTKRIPETIRGQFLDYVGVTLIDVPTDDMLISLSNMVNQSIRKTELLVKESLAQMNRQHIDTIYKRALPKTQLFEYVGPMDGRTSKACSRYVGARMTRAEWLAVDPNIFIQGLHYGCRHQLVPVDPEEEK